MKKETKVKIKIFFQKAKEKLPEIIAWGLGTMVATGTMLSFENKKKIDIIDREAGRRVHDLEEETNRQKERLETLERQSHYLYERALKETEGKAE